MTAAEDLVITIERFGGVLELDGDKLKCKLPDSLSCLLPRIKEHKAELVGLVRRRGGRIAHFPMCPKCGAYALYRKDNLEPYKCMVCKLS